MFDFQPNGPVQDENLNAPEFQPITDVTSIGLPNALHWLIYTGIERDDDDFGIGSKWYSQGRLDLTDQINIAADSEDLIDQLNTLVTAGRLTQANRTTIKNHIDSLPAGNATQRKTRVENAIWLLLSLRHI